MSDPYDYFEDETTGERNAWRMQTDIRLSKVEEVATSLRTLKWLLSLLIVLGATLAGWSIRTTLITEVRVDRMERTVDSSSNLSADIASLKTEIAYLRRDLERIAP